MVLGDSPEEKRRMAFASFSASLSFSAWFRIAVFRLTRSFSASSSDESSVGTAHCEKGWTIKTARTSGAACFLFVRFVDALATSAEGSERR